MVSQLKILIRPYPPHTIQVLTHITHSTTTRRRALCYGSKHTDFSYFTQRRMCLITLHSLKNHHHHHCSLHNSGHRQSLNSSEAHPSTFRVQGLLSNEGRKFEISVFSQVQILSGPKCLHAPLMQSNNGYCVKKRIVCDGLQR